MSDENDDNAGAIEPSKQVKQQPKETQSELKRTDSKLIKTPRPTKASTSTTALVQLDSDAATTGVDTIDANKQDLERNQATATTTTNKPSKYAEGKELAPDTTERLPHTRQLSSAALHLSPRHQPTLLVKLSHTAGSAAISTAALPVDFIGSGTTASRSSTAISTTSVTMIRAATAATGQQPSNTLSKCSSLASVSSYYLTGEDTVTNTSDEYYEEDEDDVDVDDEVFSTSNGSDRTSSSHRLCQIQVDLDMILSLAWLNST